LQLQRPTFLKNMLEKVAEALGRMDSLL